MLSKQTRAIFLDVRIAMKQTLCATKEMNTQTTTTRYSEQKNPNEK
tara:strand:+ start:208 stop:345 length:138 start_codon:yes stop_codon:yes gene_type:complete